MLGFGELVLINSVAGVPGYENYPYYSKLLSQSFLLLLGYGLYVVVLSPLTFNVAGLRILEDIFLVGYAGL